MRNFLTSTWAAVCKRIKTENKATAQAASARLSDQEEIAKLKAELALTQQCLLRTTALVNRIAAPLGDLSRTLVAAAKDDARPAPEETTSDYLAEVLQLSAYRSRSEDARQSNSAE